MGNDLPAMARKPSLLPLLRLLLGLRGIESLELVLPLCMALTRLMGPTVSMCAVAARAMRGDVFFRIDDGEKLSVEAIAFIVKIVNTGETIACNIKQEAKPRRLWNPIRPSYVVSNDCCVDFTFLIYRWSRTMLYLCGAYCISRQRASKGFSEILNPAGCSVLFCSTMVEALARGSEINCKMVQGDCL